VTAERILRGVALLVAVLAFIDPALTRAAHDRPAVVVLHASPSDRDLAFDVVAALQPVFDVSRVDVPGAAAYVVAGTDLPEDWRPSANARVFAVTPAATAPGLKILEFIAPAEVSLDSIAPLEAEVQVDGTGEREVMVSLIADGVRLSQAPRRLSGTDTRIRAALTFVPSQTGLVRLRIEAALTGRDPVVADRVIDVHARAWQVLAFDGRPSYAATFVRRALELDPRFTVTTRVVTSRASAMQTNAAPSTLTDPGSLAAFDLIIVGAPEAFGEPEARGLQRYMRERQGAVILLPETMPGILLPRLSGQAAWQEERRIDPVPVRPVAVTGSDAWAAAEFLWPVRWPPLAETLATIAAPSEGSPAPRAAVWQVPIGGGRLVVSSAIDGWRSRAGSSSGFSAFWRWTAAALAQATPPLVDVTMPRRLVMPGQWAHVSVGMFSAGAPVARLTGGSMDAPVRLWPVSSVASGTGREWSGEFRAPDLPGRYRLGVTGGAAPASVEFLVVDDAPIRAAPERDGLAVLASSTHGGRVVSADQLKQLPAQISEVVTAGPAREPWHPMRSVWWLMPFTLCAAGEWWLRRHRGER
jgi:hypothetical protein